MSLIGLTMSEQNKLDDQHQLPILNSSYNICIRKESGYNCVQYSPCSDTPAFSVSGTATSKTGSNCSTDWLEIQGGTTCGGSNSLINRYCGSKFSNADGGTIDGSVCGKSHLARGHFYATFP